LTPHLIKVWDNLYPTNENIVPHVISKAIDAPFRFLCAQITL